MKPTIVLFLALAAAGCGTPAPEGAAAAEPLAVPLGRAELTDIPASFEAGGLVRARSTAVIASRIMAPVVEVHVRAGDRVRRGAPLVTLDGREVAANRARATAALTSAVEAKRAAEAQARAAEAAVTLARATHQRIRALHEQRSATAQELDEADMTLDAAEAQLAAARAGFSAAAAAREGAQSGTDAATVAASYAILVAPFNGIVTERSVDPGSMATPGAPLLVLEDPSAFRLEVRLDEARATQVTVGRTAQVHLGGAAESPPPVAARVSEVGRIDPSSHSFLVKLDLPNEPGLRSGVFGRARFSGPPHRTLTVPASAAVRRGQLTFIFIVDADGRARLQPISPGRAGGDRLEVLAGVREGARIVISPPPSLSDGMRISEARR